MKRPETKRYELKARVLKALAHPVRLYIADTLKHGKQPVGELTRLIGLDASTVSRHLSVMREAGIIASEKRGTHVYYELCVPCVLNVFDCIESVLAAKAAEYTPPESE